MPSRGLSTIKNLRKWSNAPHWLLAVLARSCETKHAPSLLEPGSLIWELSKVLYYANHGIGLRAHGLAHASSGSAIFSAHCFAHGCCSHILHTQFHARAMCAHAFARAISAQAICSRATSVSPPRIPCTILRTVPFPCTVLSCARSSSGPQ